MKKHVVKIGYNYFLANNAAEAVQLLELKELSREYVGNKEIYTPENEKERMVILVDEEDIRTITKEEKENKELESAKSRVQWAEKEKANLQKQVEDLKCQLAGLKALKEETEETENA